MKRHYKVEEARQQAKRAIAKRIEELKAEIKARMMKAESGADWAEICSLEVQLVGLGGAY